MLEAEFLVFCRQVVIDEKGISLMGTSDGIPSTGFPVALTDSITSVAKIRAKKHVRAGALPFRLEIEYDNNVVWGTKGDYPVSKGVPKRGVIFFQVDMKGIKFDHPGWYYVNLYMGDQKLITRTLHADTPEKFKEIYGEQEIIQETD